MALGLNKTKRRIASVKNTQKITKAMEMVATVKLKRFRDAFERGLPYAASCADFISYLAYAEQQQAEKRQVAPSHYLRENEEAEGSLYIVISSNLGLCAGYNNNLYKHIAERLDSEKDTLAPIGAKAVAHYSREEALRQVDMLFAGLDLSSDLRLLHEAVRQVKDRFNSGRYRKVILIYTHYVNSLRFEPRELTLLPLSSPYEPKPYERYAPRLLSSSPRQLLHEALPTYLASAIYYKLIEAQLSEQASRRTAMENANDNADELLGKLTVEYNKARQSAITQEIVEVVSGASAQAQ